MVPVEREVPVLRELTDAGVSVAGERLTGYAIVYGQRSKLIVGEGPTPFYEIIESGAFSESMASRNVTFVFRHDDNAEYGDTRSRTLVLTDDPKGVRFDLQLPPYAGSLRQRIATGAVTGMSCSFLPTDVEFRGTHNGVPVRHVLKGDLYHVSAVYSPAYPQTSVSVVRPADALDLYDKKLKLLNL